MPNNKKATRANGRNLKHKAQPKTARAKTTVGSTKPIRPPKGNGGFAKPRPSRSAVEAVCSQVDPFCIHARGAKLFDKSMTPSIGYQVIANGTLATVGTTGQACMQVTADCITGFRLAATYTGSTVATWGSYQVPSGAAWLTTNATRFRVVSFGVRFFSVVSPMDASGLTIVATSGEVLSAPSHDSSSYLDVERNPVSGAQGQWTGKPRDDYYANYNLTSSSIPYAAYYSVCNLSVAGCPAGGPTSILGYQIVWNVEAVLGSTSSSVLLSTPAAPHLPQIEGAVAKVVSSMDSTIPGPVSNFSTLVTRHAYNALDGLLEKGLAYGMKMLTM